MTGGPAARDHGRPASDDGRPASGGRFPRRPFGRLGATLSMIKFQHTLFALPFAFTGAVLAAGGPPRGRVLGWILGAMVGARSAAMVWNRIADLRYDASNPRTADRPLVTGELGLPFAWGFLLASLLLFYLSAAMLNPLALALATPAVLIILSYSWAKRFTWLTHLHLGVSLGIAPIGGWIAVAGQTHRAPLLLGAAVAFWVAGFDVLYSCQDVEFDRTHGLHSIPARLGIPRALLLARCCHVLTVVLLGSVALVLPLGPAWLAGVAITAALLVYEHSLVRADDLSRVNQAFFTINGIVGFVVLAAACADAALRR